MTRNARSRRNTHQGAASTERGGHEEDTVPEGVAGEPARGFPGPSDSPATDGAGPDPAADVSITVVCRQVVELVTDYLEGALPSDLQAAVERHLQLCPPCVTYIEQMRATAVSLREVPVESIHPRARAELVTAFRELVPRSGRGPA